MVNLKKINTTKVICGALRRIGLYLRHYKRLCAASHLFEILSEFYFCGALRRIFQVLTHMRRRMHAYTHTHAHDNDLDSKNVPQRAAATNKPNHFKRLSCGAYEKNVPHRCRIGAATYRTSRRTICLS